MKIKELTHTFKVEEALRAADDFLTAAMIVKATKLKPNQVSAALHNLRRYRVVDVVVQPNGVGWWFTLPPEDDVRSKHLEEIVVGIKRRRKPTVARITKKG